MADIELSALVKKGLLNVFLENESFGSAILMGSSSFQDGLDFFESKADDNAVSSISQFSWFNNPDIVKPVLIPLLLPLIETLQESVVFLIIDAIFDMEGERQVIEYFFTD